MAELKPAYLGVDLGGSNSFAVAFDGENKPLIEDKISTEARGGYEHVIARMRAQIERMESALKKKGFALGGVGVGVPGVVEAGARVLTAPNLLWNNVEPLNDLGLNDRDELSAVLLNDVNAGLMGELTIFTKPPKCAVAYFCGTGIGGALALEGELLTGAFGGAGEVGHMVIQKNGRQCECGMKGCLEAYIGKWALNRKVRKYFKSGKKTALRNIIDYDLKKTPIKSSSLKKAYEKKDKFTLSLMNTYYVGKLAAGISQAVHFVNPDVLILGGGIMEALGRPLLPEIRNKVKKLCMSRPPEIRLATLEDLAGPLGAATVSARL